MSRYKIRKNRRVHDAQVGYPVHAKMRIHDAAVLQRSHASGASRMVQRLGALPDECLELFVGGLGEPVVQFGVVVADRIDGGRQRLGVRDFVYQTYAAEERLHVVGICEVSVGSVLPTKLRL